LTTLFESRKNERINDNNSPILFEVSDPGMAAINPPRTSSLQQHKLTNGEAVIVGIFTGLLFSVTLSAAMFQWHNAALYFVLAYFFGNLVIMPILLSLTVKGVAGLTHLLCAFGILLLALILTTN